MIGGLRGTKLRLAGMAAAVCATLLVHARMDTASAAARGRLYVPQPERARALSLGFAPLLADYYWIQALQVVGGATRVSETDRSLLGDLMELVTHLDPWVDHPYRFAALWLVNSPEEVRRGDAILEQGIAYHPLDWRNRFYLGYNLFFYLQEYASAADFLEEAAPLEGAPPYLGALATRLRASSDGLKTAEFFLRGLVHDAPEGYARAEYLKALDEIVTERRARFLDRARAEFRKRHGRDIREPSELWAGPLRVLESPPPAHPHFRGFTWELDPESGEIVSSYYGSRYRLHVHPLDAQRARRWREEGEMPANEGAGKPGAGTEVGT